MQRFLCCISRRDWAAQSLRTYASLGAALSQAVCSSVTESLLVELSPPSHSQASHRGPPDRKKTKKTRKICANALAACKTLAKSKRRSAAICAVLSSRRRTAADGSICARDSALQISSAASRRAGAHKPASHLAPRAQLAAQPTRRRRSATRRPPQRPPPARASRNAPRAPPVKHERLRGVRLR